MHALPRPRFPTAGVVRGLAVALASTAVLLVAAAIALPPTEAHAVAPPPLEPVPVMSSFVAVGPLRLADTRGANGFTTVGPGTIRVAVVGRDRKSVV